MVKVKLLAFLFLFSLLAMPVMAASSGECETVAVPGLMKLHLQEVHAALSAGTPLQDALRTGAAAELEDVLSKADDHYDITMIVASLAQAEKQAAKQSASYALLPLYSLVSERVANAVSQGRTDLAKTLEKLEKKMAKVSAQPTGAPMDLDLPEGWQIALITIEDNGKGRRLELFNNMVKNHGLRVVTSYEAGAQPSYTHEVTRFLISGKTDRIMKIASYYKGEVPSGMRVNMHLKSGGAFSKIESDLRVPAPAGMDAEAAMRWLETTVMAKGWDYVEENNFDLIKKHAKEKIEDGRLTYLVKSAQVTYSIEAMLSSGAVKIGESEKDQGDLYCKPRTLTGDEE